MNINHKIIVDIVLNFIHSQYVYQGYSLLATTSLKIRLLLIHIVSGIEGDYSSLWEREVRRDFINQCLHAYDRIRNLRHD